MFRTVLAVFASVLAFSSALAQSARPANGAPATANTPSPQRTPAIKPGTYDLELAFGGGTMPGTLTIKEVGDSVDAKLLVNDHAPPIKSVTRDGSKLILSGSGDGIDVRYDLQFTGETLIGKFTFNGEAGAVTGKRRP